MSRPTKQTVDYFPHLCKHGKTIYILEKKYGNNGYAFWFKLLEELGSHNGHILDLSDETEIEFLSAKTGVSDTETIDILNLLSKLDAIDKNLWEKRIVWCQNFVDNISGVYKKRTVSTPDKPISDDGNEVSYTDNPQSKVKETKLNNILQSEDCLDQFSSDEYIKQMIANKQKHISLIGKYFKEKKIGFPTLKSAQAEVKRWVRDASILAEYSDDKITDAFTYVTKKFPEEWNLSTMRKYISQL